MGLIRQFFLLILIIGPAFLWGIDCTVELNDLITEHGFNRKVESDKNLRAINLKQIPSSRSLDIEKEGVVSDVLEWSKNELVKRYQKDGKLIDATQAVRAAIQRKLVDQGFDPSNAESISKEIATALANSVDARFPLLPEVVQVPERPNMFRDDVKNILNQFKVKTVAEAVEKIKSQRALASQLPEGDRKKIQLETLDRHEAILAKFERSGEIREENVYSKIADARERQFPYGMRDSGEFRSFGGALREKLAPMLKKLRADSPKVYLGGSAITGLSFEPKLRELDLRRPFNSQSDYDVVVVIPDKQFEQLVRKGVIASDPMENKGLRSIPYSQSRAPEKLAGLLDISPHEVEKLSGLKMFNHEGQPVEVPIEKVSVSVYGESYFNLRNKPGTSDFRPMMEIPSN